MLAGARTVVNVLGWITEGYPFPVVDSGFLSPESELRKGYLDVRICPVPDQRETGHPILLVDSLACMPMLRGRQYACRRQQLGPVTFPRMVHGATRTWELFRMRLVLPMSLRVIT
jgi:hypothetical protein